MKKRLTLEQQLNQVLFGSSSYLKWADTVDLNQKHTFKIKYLTLKLETCKISNKKINLVDPNGNIAKDSSVLWEVEMPQGLLHLFERTLRLELFFARILLQIVDDSKHVGKP